MAVLHCRECGAETKSDTRQTKCKQCGTLFPFACAVCERPLRPPFHVFPDERYLSQADEPLCENHYQRLCPSCQQWFQADENPGYYLCSNCSGKLNQKLLSGGASEDDEDDDSRPVERKHAKPTSWGCLAGAIGAGICVSYVVIMILWKLVDMVSGH